LKNFQLQIFNHLTGLKKVLLACTFVKKFDLCENMLLFFIVLMFVVGVFGFFSAYFGVFSAYFGSF